MCLILFRHIYLHIKSVNWHLLLILFCEVCKFSPFNLVNMAVGSNFLMLFKIQNL